MKQVAMLFPDELYEVMTVARFNEKRHSVSEFVREAVKSYLRDRGYTLTEEMEVVKPGYKKSPKPPPITNLNEAIENYVAPKEPTPAWGATKGWNNE